MSYHNRMGVNRIKLNGSEKRYRPSKHYVFILQVKWDDGTDLVIYRKYSHFYNLQLKLLDMFPMEAGRSNQNRTIPYMPGRLLFKRPERKKIAVKREQGLEEYCQKLVLLPPKISKCDLVLDFFTATDTDITKPPDAWGSSQGASSSAESIAITAPLSLDSYIAIADYKAESRNEVTLKTGQSIEVIDKNENGWWLVQPDDGEPGWAPSTFLMSENECDQGDEFEINRQGDKYISTQAYQAAHDDEVSYPKQAEVYVLHKTFDGWWVVRYRGQVGYAPANTLIEYHNSHFKASVIMKAPRRSCTIRSPYGRTRRERDLSIYKTFSRDDPASPSTSGINRGNVSQKSKTPKSYRPFKDSQVNGTRTGHGSPKAESTSSMGSYMPMHSPLHDPKNDPEDDPDDDYDEVEAPLEDYVNLMDKRQPEPEPSAPARPPRANGSSPAQQAALPLVPRKPSGPTTPPKPRGMNHPQSPVENRHLTQVEHTASPTIQQHNILSARNNLKRVDDKNNGRQALRPKIQQTQTNGASGPPQVAEKPKPAVKVKPVTSSEHQNPTASPRAQRRNHHGQPHLDDASNLSLTGKRKHFEKFLANQS